MKNPPMMRISTLYMWVEMTKTNIRIIECVSKIKHILSVIHFTIFEAVCFQFTYYLCDDWENIYTLFYYFIIIIKSQVWGFIHCLGLGHETMVCAVCLATFVLIYISICVHGDPVLKLLCFTICISLNGDWWDTGIHMMILAARQASSKRPIYTHTCVVWHLLCCMQNGFVLG